MTILVRLTRMRLQRCSFADGPSHSLDIYFDEYGGLAAAAAHIEDNLDDVTWTDVTWTDELCNLWQIFDLSILPRMMTIMWTMVLPLLLMMVTVNVMTMMCSDDKKPGCSTNIVGP